MEENNDLQRVIDKYAKNIYRIAFAYFKSEVDAEDIVQEVLIKYMLNKKGYNDAEHEKNWIIRVTLNCCHNLRLSAWKKRIVPLSEQPDVKFETEDQTDLFNSISRLKEKYKVVVQLFYLEDLSIKSISKILNITESNVKTRLKRARRMLEADLKKGDDL